MLEEGKAALEPDVTEDTIIESTEAEAPAETATAPVDDSFVDTSNERVQARIDKITGQRYAEQRRADALQLEIDSLKAASKSNVKEPVLEDFDYDEQAYMDAKIDYKVNQKAEQIRKDDLESVRVTTETNADNDLLSAYNAKVDEFVKLKPDYDRAMSKLPEFPIDTYKMLLKTNPETMYNLANNLEAAHELASLSPIDAALKIGQLSAQPKASIKTSAAPDPIEPITTGSGSTGDEWDNVAEGCSFE